MPIGTSDRKKTLLIDFDRTIHRYKDGYKDGSVYDIPLDGAIEALQSLHKAGWELIIFTTLSDRGEARNQEIHEWILKESGLDLLVTNTKLPARAIIDDRAIRFEGNWRSILNYFI